MKSAQLVEDRSRRTKDRTGEHGLISEGKQCIVRPKNPPNSTLGGTLRCAAIRSKSENCARDDLEQAMLPNPKHTMSTTGSEGAIDDRRSTDGGVTVGKRVDEWGHLGRSSTAAIR